MRSCLLLAPVLLSAAEGFLGGLPSSSTRYSSYTSKKEDNQFPTSSSSSALCATPANPLDQFLGFFNAPKAGGSSSTATSKGQQEYVVVLTGASGMIGKALTQALSSSKVGGLPVRVVKLARGDGPSTWDPLSGNIDAKALEGADAIVHLAGENVGSGSDESIQGRLGAWTDQKKERILASRRDGTALLAKTIATLKSPPKVLLTASAVGFYGYDVGDKIFDESGPLGKGFLAEVTRVWEEEAKAASKKGVRVVNARFGVVLSKQGGIIKKLLPIFRLGGGGIIGDGKQYLSWVSLRDVVKALKFLIETPSLSGPVNVVAGAVTNSEFTSAMGQALFRPTILPLPGPAAQLLFGEMGEEMLLGGQRAVPKKLSAAGFQFQDSDILSGIQQALQE